MCEGEGIERGSNCLEVDRLLVAEHDSEFGRRPPGTRDHVVFIRAQMTAVGEGHCSVLPEFDGRRAPPVSEQIQTWLVENMGLWDGPLRATWLSQHSFLVAWASDQLEFAWRIDGGLDRFEARTLEVHALTAAQVELLRQYAAHRRIAFAARAPWRRSLALPVRTLWTLRRALDVVRRGRSTDPILNPRRPALVVASFQPNSSRAFMPVAEALRARGIVSEFLLRHDDLQSRRLVENAGLRFRFVEDFGRLSDVAALRSAVAFFQTRLGSAALGRLCSTLGFPDWVEPVALARTTRARLQRSLQRFFLDTRAIARALDTLDPQACAFITSRAAMNQLLLERRARTARIFFLQGIVPDLPPTATRMDVDLALVGSRIDLAYLDRCQIPESARRLVGYTDYDDFSSLDRDTCRLELRALLPPTAVAPWVVFTSQHAKDVFPDWARQKNLDLVVEAARLLPEVTFLLKAHPFREHLSRAFIARLPANVLLCPALPTTRLLKACDVAVTFWSTTALEAVLLGTPLVQLNGTGLPDFFDISARLGRATARSAPQLAEAIGELLCDPARRLEFAEQRERFMEECGLTLSGRSADAAAEAIAERLLGVR